MTMTTPTSSTATLMAEAEVLTRLEDSTRDAHRIQLETLHAILELNASAGYLRAYLDPSFPIDADSFRRLVPLSSYDDYADLIQRIADGAEPPIALSVDPVLCFFYSSGTSTLRPKLIPFFDSDLAKSSSNFTHQAISALLRRIAPPRPTVNKILWFLYAGNVTETKGGFRVMAASAYPFHSGGPGRSRLLSLCVSPAQVILGSDTHQQTYCHLLCGLRSSASIDGIRAPYAAGLVRAIRLLQAQWEQLCNDIEHGSVSPEITDPAMREAVEELLGGSEPELANRIRAVCGRGEWSGILAELWPALRYVACVTTGSMEQYYPLLKYYAGETIPLLGGDYLASECSVGINMEKKSPPALTSFVILPTAAYFEFLPFELGAPTAAEEVVDISGVEIGKMYEMVVTTYRGLYRYRLGDVIRVVGFYNASPRVEFVTRAPKEATEVFTEKDLMAAMESFQLMLQQEGWGEVAEYSGFLDLDSSKKHLVVFVEVSKDCMLTQKERMQESMNALRRWCPFLEGGLGSVYKMKRNSGELGPLEVCVVSPGSFDGLAIAALESGAPANQYKPPKFLRNCKFVHLLEASVVLALRMDDH